MTTAGWTNDGETVTLYLRGEKEATVKIYLFGAHVASWQDGKDNVLFLSSKAKLDGTKAIRGGIPICFPQFGGLGSLPNHGFARTSVWQVSEAKAHSSTSEEASVSVTFLLEPNERIRKIWQNEFRTEYTVTLCAGNLKFDWKVYNKNSSEPFTFTGALHTYFNVPDVAGVSVRGLDGLTYTDKVRNNQQFKNTGDLKITGFTDRVFHNAPDTVEVLSGDSVLVTVKKTNMADAVVWNPWAANAKKMSDFGDNEYPGMLCVEAGAVNTPVTVQAGKVWNGTMTLSKL